LASAPDARLPTCANQDSRGAIWQMDPAVVVEMVVIVVVGSALYATYECATVLTTTVFWGAAIAMTINGAMVIAGVDPVIDGIGYGIGGISALIDYIVVLAGTALALPGWLVDRVRTWWTRRKMERLLHAVQEYALPRIARVVGSTLRARHILHEILDDTRDEKLRRWMEKGDDRARDAGLSRMIERTRWANESVQDDDGTLIMAGGRRHAALMIEKKIRGVTAIKRLDTEEKRKIEKRRTREKRQRAPPARHSDAEWAVLGARRRAGREDRVGNATAPEIPRTTRAVSGCPDEGTVRGDCTTASPKKREEEKIAELRQQLQAERGRRVRAERSERRLLQERETAGVLTARKASALDADRVRMCVGMENARKSRTRVRLESVRRAAERAMAAAMQSPPVTPVKDITVERRETVRKDLPADIDARRAEGEEDGWPPRPPRLPLRTRKQRESGPPT
jgi:hypothetical protein